jgi:hypothetical protein
MIKDDVLVFDCVEEALLCLKRRISDAVFKSLMADSQTPSRGAA